MLQRIKVFNSLLGSSQKCLALQQFGDNCLTMLLKSLEFERGVTKA